MKFYFLGKLADVVEHAIKILHKQKDIMDLESVIVELKKTSREEFFEFYQQIALEAFQYEAEFGSITALDWALTLAMQMSYLIQDRSFESLVDIGDFTFPPYQQYVVLVDIGMTMYNYVRDVKHRYAISDQEQQHSMEIFDCYLGLVKGLVGIGRHDKLHLVYLADLIYAAQVTSSPLNRSEMHRSNAITKSRRMLQLLNNSWQREHCPSILIGLHLHHSGKLHYMNGNYHLAWIDYYNALDYLKFWEDYTGSTASYYFDVIYGECFTKSF